MTSCAPPSTIEVAETSVSFAFSCSSLMVKRAAVAHRRFDLGQRKVDIVMQGACIRHVGIYAFLELHARVAAKVVALPVARAVGAFAPVFLDVIAVDIQLVGRRFVEAREISAQHDEIRAHRQRQCHMVVVDDTAVGADRHIDARLFVVFIPRRSDLDDRGRLSAADTFLLSA